ncbi:hypothetical protein [Laribacter hongkongensis]|uniref:hypothetical protein n=1 Tax=Laribacter hongkongensis TaxID=168471 RepID=UPI00167FB60D|nr:hypothetical protein [Laribacter hongkongensis]
MSILITGITATTGLRSPFSGVLCRIAASPPITPASNTPPATSQKPRFDIEIRLLPDSLMIHRLFSWHQQQSIIITMKHEAIVHDSMSLTIHLPGSSSGFSQAGFARPSKAFVAAVPEAGSTHAENPQTAGRRSFSAGKTG